jgi:hypothetical protein
MMDMIETNMNSRGLDLDFRTSPTCDGHHDHIRTRIRAFKYFMESSWRIFGASRNRYFTLIKQKLFAVISNPWVLLIRFSFCYFNLQHACWLAKLHIFCFHNPTILWFQFAHFIFISQFSACATWSCLFFDCLMDECSRAWVVKDRDDHWS